MGKNRSPLLNTNVGSYATASDRSWSGVASGMLIRLPPRRGQRLGRGYLVPRTIRDRRRQNGVRLGTTPRWREHIEAEDPEQYVLMGRPQAKVSCEALQPLRPFGSVGGACAGVDQRQEPATQGRDRVPVAARQRHPS